MTTPLPPAQPGDTQDPRRFSAHTTQAFGPPRRKRRLWPILLVTVGILTIALCGFGAVRVYLGLKHVDDVANEVNEATASFLENTRDGLNPTDYDGLCADFKQRFSLKDATELMDDAQPMTTYRIVDTTVDSPEATVKVELHRADGTTSRNALFLTDEDERWRMCSLPY